MEFDDPEDPIPQEKLEPVVKPESQELSGDADGGKEPEEDRTLVSVGPESGGALSNATAAAEAVSGLAEPMDADADADDIVVREIDVYCNPQIDENTQLYLIQYPLRPSYRYDLDGRYKEVRIKPKSAKVEIDVEVPESSDCLSTRTMTLRSSTTLVSDIETRGITRAVGVLLDNKLHLNPLYALVQLRPSTCPDDDEEEPWVPVEYHGPTSHLSATCLQMMMPANRAPVPSTMSVYNVGKTMETAESSSGGRESAPNSFLAGGTMLPTSLITEIMLRLPSKALARFKAVHRSWRAVLSDKYFISEHYRRRASSYDKIYYALLAYRGQPPELLPINPSTNNLDLSLPEDFDGVGVHDILGPCFGIYCLILEDSRMGLWNWSTGELKLVYTVQGKILSNVGFGYMVDEGGLIDFKIVGYDLEVKFSENEFYVYTLSTDSWKSLRLPSKFSRVFIDCYPTSCTTVVNGAFHWMVIPSPEHNFILSFDMKSERFRTIQLSEFGTLFTDMTHIDDETLCIGVTDSNTGTVEIWAMKEYGNTSTWYSYVTVEQARLSNGYFVHGLFFRDFNADVLGCEGMKRIRMGYRYGGDNYRARIFRYEESLISVGGRLKK